METSDVAVVIPRSAICLLDLRVRVFLRRLYKMSQSAKDFWEIVGDLLHGDIECCS